MRHGQHCLCKCKLASTSKISITVKGCRWHHLTWLPHSFIITPRGSLTSPDRLQFWIPLLAPIRKTMSSTPKLMQMSAREDNESLGFLAMHYHMLMTANGEQDQGIPFKGPTSSDIDSAVSDSPDLGPAEIPMPNMSSALRRDSFKNIGQRRRSSASNQPAVNLRKGICPFWSMCRLMI